MCFATAFAGQAGFVANMADIAPGSAGQMFGLCGTFASLAGIIATSSVGLVVERTGDGVAPWTYINSRQDGYVSLEMESALCMQVAWTDNCPLVCRLL